jgi:putative transcriptional regulator
VGESADAEAGPQGVDTSDAISAALDRPRTMEIRHIRKHQRLCPVKNRLRVLRTERNWSQQELANRVGVSRQAINAVETGRFDPSLPLALKLARTFDASVEAIFELEQQRQ